MLKINILSAGRFHMLDLARELNLLGYDVKFYSFVPLKRAESFGLPKSACKCLLLPLFPFVCVERKLGKKIKFAGPLRKVVQDFITGRVMRKCDVLIALSGDYVYSLKKAKEDNTIVILERGSKHIRTQKEILDNVASTDVKRVSSFDVKRELQGYDMADYISVPSNHVFHSFLNNNYPESKLFVNSYGADLDMFYPLDNNDREYDVIFVGNWCYQKGCDLLTEALTGTSIKMLHVGAVGDMPFPNETNMYHHDPVDQHELVKYYGKAKIFILVSRQDGFGMVLGQAAVCGLPIVCSKDTGGQDIKNYVEDKSWIVVLPSTDPVSIRKAVIQLLDRYQTYSPQKGYLGKGRENLSWRAYGERYSVFLEKIHKNVNGE